MMDLHAIDTLTPILVMNLRVLISISQNCPALVN